MTTKTITQLLSAAQELRGLTLADLAIMANCKLDKNLKYSKGSIGVLFEKLLGATAQSKPLPDFPEIGVELKTIPVDKNFTPIESTYICTAHQQNIQSKFEESLVALKINKILWIPIISNQQNNDTQTKIVGKPFIWSPNKDEYEIIKTDWQEITDLLLLGHSQQITARLGTALHLRPKGAFGNSVAAANNEKGEKVMKLTRGFYLRRSFTKSIIQNNYNY